MTEDVDRIRGLMDLAIRTPDALRAWLEQMQPSDEVGRASGGPDGVLVTWLRRTIPLWPPTTFLVDGKTINVRVREAGGVERAVFALPMPGWAVALSTIEREEAVGLAPEQRWRASEVLGWLGRIKD